MSQSPSQKLLNYLASFDPIEWSETTVRVCGALALVFLAASFAPDLVLVMDFSRPYQVAQFSQDEFWFMEEILKLQDLILNFDISGIRAFGSPFAYGFPFWLAAALVALPFHGHAMPMVLFLRLICMATKYAAFYVVYRRVLDLTQKPLLALLTLTLLLAVPAFVFDGKIIGPELPIMLLIAVSWSALFSLSSGMQALAAFCFAYAFAIKFNVAPLGLIFPLAWFAYPAKERGRIAIAWGLGALPALLLFLVPENPLKEILAVAATHHVDYGLQYLSGWYAYDALEFDDMLKGGWRVDFIAWPFFFVFLGYAIARAVKGRAARPKGWPPHVLPIIVATFFAAVLTCFLTSLNSLMHPWFVFAPFMLLVASGGVLVGMGRGGTALMLIFVLAYILDFGDRYVARWEHRLDKFEYVAATEPADAAVASWIVANCPKAREGAIDYNLMWPSAYDGGLKKMWTLIEIEDYRRLNGGADALLDNIDLLLLKADRVNALLPPPKTDEPQKVSGAILGNFFADSAPFFIRRHDFPHLSIFAREGVCKKEGN